MYRTWSNLPLRHNKIFIPHTFSFFPFLCFLRKKLFNLCCFSEYLYLSNHFIDPRLSASFSTCSTSLCFTLHSLYLFLHICINLLALFFHFLFFSFFLSLSLSLSLSLFLSLFSFTFHVIHLYFSVDEYKERKSR